MLSNIKLNAWSILSNDNMTNLQKTATHYLADSQRNIGIYK